MGDDVDTSKSEIHSDPDDPLLSLQTESQNLILESTQIEVVTLSVSVKM